MNLLLERFLFYDQACIGKLFIDGKFECYILEDKVRPEGNKIFGKTAIPYGKYKIAIYDSPHFKKRLPLILNVPNYKGIEIHSGNKAEDTKGCLLTGTSYKGPKVLNSRNAFKALFEKIDAAFEKKEEIWIEIKQALLNEIVA